MHRVRDLLVAYERAYQGLSEARESGNVDVILHAERNFMATAEAFARRIPMLLEDERPSLTAVPSAGCQGR